MPARRPPWRSLLSVAAAALALLATGTSGTQSAWTSGVVQNPSDSAQSAGLAFGHSYPSATCSQGIRIGVVQDCVGSIASTAAASTSDASVTDTIANTGSIGGARLQADVRAPSCAPVRLDNRVSSGNPLLPRYGTSFHTSGGPMDSAGYITLDGASAGGYATSTVATVQPGAGLVSAGTLSGVGIWFKAAAGTTGPLFSFSASAANGAGSADRALYLDGAGKLRFTWNVGGSTIGPSSVVADGGWHFAYVTFAGINVALVGLIPQVSLWVDGVLQDSSPLISLSPMTSYSGYWHVGWAPPSATGLTTSYVGASVSNFVVINSGTIPSGTAIGKPTTQAAFDAATSSATQRWLLDDPGTTTFTGTLPSSMTAPCSQVTIGWSFTSPAGTATAPVALSTFADNSWRTIPAPPAGGTQTSTITTRRVTSGYLPDVAGLHLYTPLSYRVQAVPTGSPWVQTFTWTGAEAAFIA